MILSLDIGSSSVRVALYDGDANLIPKTSVKIERTIALTPDGGAAIDADEALNHVEGAIDGLLAKTGKFSTDITHVASCSFWHSLLGVDAKGKPTTKVLTWADRRSRYYSAVLKKKLDEQETHSRTGAMFHSSFWPAKLLWLRSEFPDVFAKTTHWLSLSDYIALKLFGVATTSVSMASGTGIFDIRRCVWDKKLLDFLKIDKSQLAVISGDTETFRLRAEYRKRWPSLADVHWLSTVADGVADNIGSACDTKKKAALMVGTSAAMRVVYAGDPPKKIPKGLWCYRVDRKRVIVGGALSDGGNLHALIRERFNLPANTDEIIANREPADGLVVIPFFHGERSTGYDENAAGAIIGMTAAHDGIDVLRAAMEGVAFRLDDIFTRLRKVAKIEEIVASGGALRESPTWIKIISEVLDRDLTLNGVSEASMRGAVLLAAKSLGKIEVIK